MRTAFGVVTVVVTLVLGMFGPGVSAVAAGPENGAETVTQVRHLSSCIPVSAGGVVYEHCYELKAVFHITRTPSGNTSFTDHFTVRFTDSVDGTVVFEKEEHSWTHLLMRDGSEQEVRDVYHFHVVTPAFACTTDYVVHRANNRVQYVDYENTCEDD